MTNLRRYILGHPSDIGFFFDLGKNWIWRGQSNYQWPLATTLERPFTDENKIYRTFHEKYLSKCDYSWGLLPSTLPRFESLPYFEERLLEEFKRSLCDELPRPPSSDDFIDWLAIMQHHGAPTRLLDITRSPYVAAYFASKDVLEDNWGTLWGFNVLKLGAKAEEYTQSLGFPAYKGPERYSQEVSQWLYSSTSNQTLNRIGGGVILAYPFKVTERMRAQHSGFLVPFDLRTSFSGNLASAFSLEERWDAVPTSMDTIPLFPDTSKDVTELGISIEHPVICIHIHPIFKSNILERLASMGISEQAMFPDLDGVARGIAVKARRETRDQRLSVLNNDDIHAISGYLRKMRE